MRRVIDTTGLFLFHVAILALIAWSDRKQASGIALFAVLVLGVDLTYFFSPPKQRPHLEPKPDTQTPLQQVQIKSFALELLVLLAPPLVLISWFLFLVWTHQTLNLAELMAMLIAMPVVVWLVSAVMKTRMTRHHVGVINQTTKFIAYSMLATWIGSTFLFVLLLVSLICRVAAP